MSKVRTVLLSAAAMLAAGSLILPAQVGAQTAQPGTAGPTASAPAARAAPASALIDINSASREELDALPGIGPARAEAIIKGRPYRGKDELTRRDIIPSSVYDGIKDRIIAKQS